LAFNNLGLIYCFVAVYSWAVFKSWGCSCRPKEPRPIKINVDYKFMK
jgi:hypothetical protein